MLMTYWWKKSVRTRPSANKRVTGRYTNRNFNHILQDQETCINIIHQGQCYTTLSGTVQSKKPDKTLDVVQWKMDQNRLRIC